MTWLGMSKIIGVIFSRTEFALPEFEMWARALAHKHRRLSSYHVFDFADWQNSPKVTVPLKLPELFFLTYLF